MSEASSLGRRASFVGEVKGCWERLPNKALFFVLLAAWLALFQFAGNSTLGYVRSPSLFVFLLSAYHPNLLDWLRHGQLGEVSHWLAQGEEGHCLVVPLVVLGLYWWKRKELMGLTLGLWPPGLLLLGLAAVMHVFAFLVQQPKLSVLALLTGLYGLMGLAWGPAWLRRSFFPFFLLIFCMPLGAVAQPVTFRLRLLTCQLVDFVANYLLAIDVQREGTALISRAGHYQYEVEAACSGMHSLIATVGLAVVFAFVWFRARWRRAALVLAAFPLAVLGNLARMLAIIIAAEMGGQAAGNKVHDGGPLGIYSLLPYALAFAGLLLAAHWLRERPTPATAWVEPSRCARDGLPSVAPAGQGPRAQGQER